MLSGMLTQLHTRWCLSARGCLPTVQSVCSMYMGAREGHDFIYVNKESERKKEAVVH